MAALASAIAPRCRIIAARTHALGSARTALKASKLPHSAAFAARGSVLTTRAARFSTDAAPASTPTAPASSSSNSTSGLDDSISQLFPLLRPPEHLTLRLDASLGALFITMNRPTLHNAFNEHLIAEMRAVFDAVARAVNNPRPAPAASAASSDAPAAAPPQLRAVVLTGSGASFSAGADLHWMAKMRAYTEQENLADARLLFRMIEAIQLCPVPTLARVNGAALGGGVGLVAACDMAFSTAGAKFGLTEVKLGLSPAIISSFVMSKMTPAASRYYFLTGQRFDAEEAARVGLITKVCADATALDQCVQSTLEELALNSPAAVRATKALLGRITESPSVPDSEPYVTALIARLRVSNEGQEGLAAFFEKRKPQWIPAHLGNPKPKGDKAKKA